METTDRHVLVIRTNPIEEPITGGIRKAVDQSITIGDIRKMLDKYGSDITDDTVIILAKECQCQGVRVYAPLTVQDICGTRE
jgi:hypothetical protein